jgi:glycosyltransferase involved in cell wall biosynthesis
MINLNMEKTILQSILSINNQLDENYEIVIVDGGSSDKSLSILKKAKLFIKNLNVIELKRDNKRYLGEDRNISIQHAKGDYILLHLDCDDVYFPYIKSWVKAFHIVEKLYGDDILISGLHINMEKKNTLIKKGPYKNVLFEDRNMWATFLNENNLIMLDHVDIAQRLPKSRYDIYIRKLTRTHLYILEDLKSYPFGIIKYYIEKITKRSFNFKEIIFDILLMPYIFIVYFLKIKNEITKTKEQYKYELDKWHTYKSKKTTLTNLVKKQGSEINKNDFNEIEKFIFKID